MYTKDELIEKAVSVHGDRYDYSLLPSGVRMSSVVDIVCQEHGVFSQTLKNHINQRQGCPKCGRNKAKSESQARGLEKYIQTEHERFGGMYSLPNIENEYKGSHSVITVKCNVCGNVFKKRASDHITSKDGGCSVCLADKRKVEYTYEKLCGLSNKSVDIKPFDGTVEKNGFVTCICPVHGEYKVRVTTIVKGNGFCKKCSSRTTDEESGIVVSDLKKTLDDKYCDEFIYDLIGVRNKTSKVPLTCTKCGYKFKRMAKFILSDKHCGCSRCTARKTAMDRVKTTEEYIEQAKAVHGDAYDYSETEYRSSSDKVTVKCRKCGRYFDIEANSHLQGHGCPYHFTNKSRDEVELLDFIKSVYQGPVYNNDRTALGNGNELDIYLPEKNIAFEYDGIFWHNENNKPNNYHLEKTKLCESKGIRLIHIFEDEWKDKAKKEIWKSMILNILGMTSNTIGARGCEVRKVDHSEGYKFLEDNHLQGKCPSSIMLGLYHEGKLISLMTFGKSRHFVGNGKYQYELLRFCSEKGTRVIGGASRLFKYFVNKHNPESVVSYADRRWSVGGLYKTLGFEKYNESKPNYYYLVGGKRKNRFNFRKSRLVSKYGCDPSISEREFCKSMKWYRIYDCGCLCYRWISPE